MSEKIFYRPRRQSKKGDKQPRYQWVADLDIDLDLVGKHLRFEELKFLADVLGAELLELPPTE